MKTARSGNADPIPLGPELLGAAECFLKKYPTYGSVTRSKSRAIKHSRKMQENNSQLDKIAKKLTLAKNALQAHVGMNYVPRYICIPFLAKSFAETVDHHMSTHEWTNIRNESVFAIELHGLKHQATNPLTPLTPNATQVRN
ncbi:hypothetical protein ACQR3P_22855 [Rhodococcus sp. IEGM1300]